MGFLISDELCGRCPVEENVLRKERSCAKAASLGRTWWLVGTKATRVMMQMSRKEASAEMYFRSFDLAAAGRMLEGVAVSSSLWSCSLVLGRRWYPAMLLRC